jgi:hypothetical protein
MEKTEYVSVTGYLKIDRFNQAGKLVESRMVPNLVVTVGKGFIASKMAGAVVDAMSHMELGTSSVAANNTDTTLVAPVAGSRRSFDSSAMVVGSTVTYYATFGPGVATGALTEAGIFNAATGGIMLCRTVFAVVNKPAGDTINIAWTVTIN